jgi:hypothetical protein
MSSPEEQLAAIKTAIKVWGMDSRYQEILIDDIASIVETGVVPQWLKLTGKGLRGPHELEK